MNWIITKNTCIITNNHHNHVRILHEIYFFCINELKMVPLNVSLPCKGVMWKSHKRSHGILVHSIWWHGTTLRVPHGRPYMWFGTSYSDMVGLCHPCSQHGSITSISIQHVVGSRNNTWHMWCQHVDMEEWGASMSHTYLSNLGSSWTNKMLPLGICIDYIEAQSTCSVENMWHR